VLSGCGEQKQYQPIFGHSRFKYSRHWFANTSTSLSSIVLIAEPFGCSSLLRQSNSCPNLRNDARFREPQLLPNHGCSTRHPNGRRSILRNSLRLCTSDHRPCDCCVRAVVGDFRRCDHGDLVHASSFAVRSGTVSR